MIAFDCKKHIHFPRLKIKIKMQEYIYTTRVEKIISQTFLIWVFIILQILLNLFPIFYPTQHSFLVASVFVNIILLAINITSIKLLLSYKKYSDGKKLVVTKNEIKMIDEKTNASITLKTTEIFRIEMHACNKSVRLPWFLLSYFSLHDSQGNKIVVTSFMVGIYEFGDETLTRKMRKAEKIEYEDNVPRIE
jgi:hypothetical protein